LEYALWRDYKGPKLNWAHQLLAYAYENTMAENTYTIQKNTEELLDASNDVGLEVNPEKTKLMSMLI
jgi:hypothetical protein